ncbi:hypothetical protein K2173_007660 [Erythroxylum novogranatense]|uniref:CBM20 domain-containing protein n=1 Tax=Erythroxylum novogranatense TaxID=1862640 RepID=A0AAV8TV45_9ROSI|nr:hypothetical protein K2173_007660 [Erythroxylum novogranatense]
MAATTGLSTGIFARTRYGNTPSRLTFQGPSDFGFSTSDKFKKLHFDRSILLPSTNARSAPILRVASKTEVPLLCFQPSKTVHLKFQLQKECNFGEHFLLVGDDPMLGLWNPFNAIPLNWSDEHVWSVELDAPIGLTLQFKFILKRETGEIIWQPGPDRIFKTWESRSGIIVVEDWENAEAQKIMEEFTVQVKPGTGPELELSTAGNVHHQKDELISTISKDVTLCDSIVQEDDKRNVKNDLVTRENIIRPLEEHINNVSKSLKLEESVGYKMEETMNNKKPITLTGSNAAEESIGYEMAETRNKKKPINLTRTNLATSEEEESLPRYEERQLLMPGLTPIQSSSTKEAFCEEFGSILNVDSSASVDESNNQIA